MSFEINLPETSGPLVNSFLSGNLQSGTIISICPYSFMVNKSFLTKYLPWIASRSGNNAIVVGDYLERHNISVFNGISMEEAAKKAITKGEKINTTIDQVISNHELEHAFERLCIREIIESDEFQDIHDEVMRYKANDALFNEDLIEQVFIMLDNSNRAKFIRNQLVENDVETLQRYIVEELSFYLYMYQKGYYVEIYPGRDMHVLRRLANDVYHKFPYQFSLRTHISLRNDNNIRS